MTVALAGRVEDALAGLDADETAALEAREREGADYKAIAARLGTGREGVADLLVSARLAVRAHVRSAPVPERRSSQCAPARRVMAAQQDGEAVGLEDVERLREHLADCEPCRQARRDLREAALACAAWRRAPREDVQRIQRAIRPRPAPRAGVAAGRRRLAVAVAAVLLLVLLLAVVLGGGGDDVTAPKAPVPQQGSATGSGDDVVPPPGETFCAEGEPDC